MKKIQLFLAAIGFIATANAQTNVFDDIIATSPNHTYLEAALLQEGLDSVLRTAPAVTVFAPDDAAFDNLATALGTNIAGLLALPNLTDVLLYHVITSSVPSSAVTNGLIATPASPTNTIKLTKTSTNMVYANQAMVNAADLMANNGYVHSINAVMLPAETVVDIAIDNNFTSLTQAVVTAELLPALTNPFATFTVFAPTNQAFSDLATALGTDLNGILANPQLTNILLYHVADTILLSNQLTNGALATLYGEPVTVAISGVVNINTAEVTTADLQASNGVVHVIDEVLVPATLGVEDEEVLKFSIYPNPSSEMITVESKNMAYEEAIITDMQGKVVLQTILSKTGKDMINISNLSKGTYNLQLRNKNVISHNSFIVL